MRYKKYISSITAITAIACCSGITVVNAAAADWIYIGGNYVLDASSPYWVNGAPSAAGTLGEDGCIAYFDVAAGTLHLAGEGTISGVGDTKNGTALFESVGDMTIELHDGADITFEGAGSVAANGIYINGYSLTVKGNGTLRVSSGTASAGKSAAIWAKGLTVDGATLIAEAGSGVTGSYAIMTEGSPVILKNGASVTATGDFSAFDTAPQFEGYTPDIIAYGGADGNTEVEYNEADSTRYKKVVITGEPSFVSPPPEEETPEVPVLTPAEWTYIGGNYMLGADTPYWTNGAPSADGTPGKDGCLAYFDSSSGTLYLAGTGTISGVADTKNGTALFEGIGDMTIALLEGADITIEGADSATANGIYINGYSLTIKGNGTLRVSSGTASAGKSAAIWAKGLTVDGATLIAEAGTGVTGSYAIMTEGSPITLKNGASITAVGDYSALDTAFSLEGDAQIKAYGGDGLEAEYDPGNIKYYKRIEVIGDIDSRPPSPSLPIKTGVYLGGDDGELGSGGKLFYKNGELTDNAVLGEDGCIAQYIPETNTLKLAGTGEIKRSTYSDKTYGVIYSDKGDLNIELAEDADITLKFTAEGQWVYGIYVNSGSLNITGSGKLTIDPGESSNDENGDASAICTYSGGNIVIDGAKVIADGGRNGYGLSPYPQKGGKVEIKNGASVVARGGKGAVWVTDIAPVIYDGANIEASESYYKSEPVAYDQSKVSEYRYIKIGDIEFDVPEEPNIPQITGDVDGTAEAGTELTAIASGDEGSMLYIVQYNGSGELIGISAASAQDGIINAAMTVQESDGGTVKVLLWNAQQKAACDAVILPYSEK